MSRLRPLILLTNDDGIEARGLQILADALASMSDVVVCAPARDQSGVSHAITLHRPLRLRSVGKGRFAVFGTPADAVFMALAEICDRRPDLVISGINHGANMGRNVIYSGTVAGAIEGALRKIPAIAVSQHRSPRAWKSDREQESSGQLRKNLSQHSGSDDLPLDELLGRCAEFVSALAQTVLEHPFPAETILNLNAPDRPSKTFVWTRCGAHTYQNQIIRGTDPRGNTYYWVGGAQDNQTHEVGTDVHAVEHGHFSLTAMSLDWSAAPGTVPDIKISGYQNS